MAKVLYVANAYPELSQTYIETERRIVHERAETFLLALLPANLENPDHLPYRLHKWWLTEWLGRGRTRAFRIGPDARRAAPDLVHAHWMHMAGPARRAARACDVPWTIRTHSFDIMERSDEELAANIRRCNETDCAGVLAFPFLRERLLRLGLKEDKLVDAPPVVDAQRFDDLGPNGPGVIFTSAVRPKKGFADYYALSGLVPDRPFSVYPLAIRREKIGRLNDDYQGNVKIRQPVAHSVMLAEWKKHTWLVYPGSPGINSIGWPIAVAEAWAAGVGVCMQRLRPDLDEYIANCGVLFDDVDELPDVLQRDPDPAMRERAHTRTMGMDIRKHIHLLYDLWAKAGVTV